MRKIQPADIRLTADYELDRAQVRARLIEIKRNRRIAVGPNMTVLFENRDTMIYQVQEMMRVEKITDLAAIKHEIDTYNELVPGPDALTATILLEYDVAEERDERLKALLGLENHVWLEIDGEEPVPAEFDLRQMSPHRISSVHYVQFNLGPARSAAIRNGATIALTTDHPELKERTHLTAPQRQALAQDLSAD
jgi:hypothetical protein